MIKKTMSTEIDMGDIVRGLKTMHICVRPILKVKLPKWIAKALTLLFVVKVETYTTKGEMRHQVTNLNTNDLLVGDEMTLEHIFKVKTE